MVKNHNPFAVNDVIFAKVLEYDWRQMNHNGCSLVWGHPQGPTLDAHPDRGARGGGRARRRLRPDLRLRGRRRRHRVLFRVSLGDARQDGERAAQAPCGIRRSRPIGLGGVLDIFRHGRLPVERRRTGGPGLRAGGRARRRSSSPAPTGSSAPARRCSSARACSRYGVRIVGARLPGRSRRDRPAVPGSGARLRPRRGDRDHGRTSCGCHYDGNALPAELQAIQAAVPARGDPRDPRGEARPLRGLPRAFPGIEIRSVTSGFPSRELGVRHRPPRLPARDQQGLGGGRAGAVADHAAPLVAGADPDPGRRPLVVRPRRPLLRAHPRRAARTTRARNMPLLEDRQVGAPRSSGRIPSAPTTRSAPKGANFLTWSCLHHLGEQYGDLFRPTAGARGAAEHRRGLVPAEPLPAAGRLEAADADEEEDLEARILGPSSR